MKATKAQVETLAMWMQSIHHGCPCKGKRIFWHAVDPKLKDCYRFVARELLERPPECLRLNGTAPTGEWHD